MDRDRAEVVRLLLEAQQASGLSQAGFARALGTSGSRLSTYLTGTTQPSALFVVRAGRIGAAIAGATVRGLMSAPATAAAMRSSLRAEEIPWVWRMLLQGRDHLAILLAELPELVGAWEARPESTGHQGWDALLAALAEHEFELAGVAPPAWTTDSPLTEPWRPEHPWMPVDWVVRQTPDWLRGKKIFIPARDLVTA